MIDCLTQRIELNYIIPAVRKEFIRILEKKGLSDAEISRKLEITKAAVSQYKHKKRGQRISFNAKIKKEIESSAERIMNGKNSDAEIVHIIKMLKESRGICVVCRECGCK